MIFYGKPKIIKKEERRAEYLRCDVCKNKITKTYYAVTTGHHDWGNDSIDSIEHKEICINCISKFTIEYLKENVKRNTDYIEIEKEYFRPSYYGNYDEYDKNNYLVEKDDLIVEEDNE